MSEKASPNQREVPISTPSDPTGDRIYKVLREIHIIVNSINFFKSLLEEKYKSWDAISETVVKELKDRENAIANVTWYSNVGKVAAYIGMVVGSGVLFAAAIYTGNKMVINATKITGICSLGIVNSKVSEKFDKCKTKENYKKAIRDMDNLIERTKEFDSCKTEYFRLLEEYNTKLNDLDRKEIKFIFNELNEHNANIPNEGDIFVSSVQNFIPPTLPKMETLKLDEELLHVEKFKFNLMTKIAEFIRKDPLMSEILKWICKRLTATTNGESPIKARELVQSGKNCENSYNFNKSITSSDDEYENSTQLLSVLTRSFDLLLEIPNHVITCLSIQEEKAQIEEIRRVATELENYRTEVRKIMKKTFGWE